MNSAFSISRFRDNCPIASRDNCLLSDESGKHYIPVMTRTFREAFIAALEETRLSIAKVAALSGVSAEQLKKLKQRETAKTNVDDAVKVASAFGRTLEEFIDDPDTKYPIEIVHLYSGLSPELQARLVSYGRGLGDGQDLDSD
jgi:transcriptional regulator with XRE-family HTH domain